MRKFVVESQIVLSWSLDTEQLKKKKHFFPADRKGKSLNYHYLSLRTLFFCFSSQFFLLDPYKKLQYELTRESYQDVKKYHPIIKFPTLPAHKSNGLENAAGSLMK